VRAIKIPNFLPGRWTGKFSHCWWRDRQVPKLKFKNFVLVLAVVVFAWGVLFVSFGKTLASTPPANLPTPSSVDYFLTYPGVLPGNFLYPLKMVRDRIWLFLTTDPLQKAQTLLLFADKRLGAGKVLIEKGKKDLGITTLSKAEKYLERALIQGKIAREKGKESESFFNTLEKASQKHQEVLLEIQEKLSEEDKKRLEEVIKYPQRIYKEAQGLSFY